MIDETNCNLFSMEHFENYLNAARAAAEAREQVFISQAQQAFDFLKAYEIAPTSISIARDSKTGILIAKNPAADALNLVISNCLNDRSIAHFIEIVLADGESAKQAARAIKRHTENHAMKSEVFQWLDSQAKFKSNEAAALAITKQQPIAHVTARDWYKEWKKLRSASTP